MSNKSYMRLYFDSPQHQLVKKLKRILKAHRLEYEPYAGFALNQGNGNKSKENADGSLAGLTLSQPNF